MKRECDDCLHPCRNLARWRVTDELDGNRSESFYCGLHVPRADPGVTIERLKEFQEKT